MAFLIFFILRARTLTFFLVFSSFAILTMRRGGRPPTKQELLSQQQAELNQKKKEEEDRRAQEEERRKDAERRRQLDEERRMREAEEDAIRQAEQELAEEEARRQAAIEEANRPKSLQELLKQKEEEKAKRKQRFQAKASTSQDAAVSQPTGAQPASDTAAIAAPAEAKNQFDLLGGLSDIEEEEPKDIPPPLPARTPLNASLTNSGGLHLEQVFGERESTAGSFDTNVAFSASSAHRTHRQAPQRGPVDVQVDNFFDRRAVAVPVFKQAKSDGQYRFGQRLMRAFAKDGQLYVQTGSQAGAGAPLAEWVATHELVEVKRVDALRAAAPVLSMITNVAAGGSAGQSFMF